MTLGIKIAFLCDRLGPYDFAQLNAVSVHAKIVAIRVFDWIRRSMHGTL